MYCCTLVLPNGAKRVSTNTFLKYTNIYFCSICNFYKYLNYLHLFLRLIGLKSKDVKNGRISFEIKTCRLNTSSALIGTNP